MKKWEAFFSFYPVCMKNMSLLPLAQFTNEEEQVGQLPTEFSKEPEDNVISVLFFSVPSLNTLSSTSEK